MLSPSAEAARNGRLLAVHSRRRNPRRISERWAWSPAGTTPPRPSEVAAVGRNLPQMAQDRRKARGWCDAMGSPYVPVLVDFHKSSAWLSLRRRFKEHCRITGARCHLCEARGDQNSEIDYVTPRTGRSFEADHYWPVETHPHLALSWNCLRASHQRCNRARGSKPVEPQGEWCRPDW